MSRKKLEPGFDSIKIEKALARMRTGFSARPHGPPVGDVPGDDDSTGGSIATLSTIPKYALPAFG
jgi:hypothetical protein